MTIFFDPYQALELSYGVSDAEIKTQYRKLVKKYHPDHNSNPKTQEKLNSIIKAYRLLSDPNQKKEFDRQREEKIFGQYRPKPETEAFFNGFKSFASKIANEYLDGISEENDEDVDPGIYDLCDVSIRSTRSNHKINISIPKEMLDHWREDRDYWIQQLLNLIDSELRSKI